MKSYEDMNNQSAEKRGVQVKEIFMGLLTLCWLGIKISNYVHNQAVLVWFVGISVFCAILVVVIKLILDRKQKMQTRNKFKR